MGKGWVVGQPLGIRRCLVVTAVVMALVTSANGAAAAPASAASQPAPASAAAKPSTSVLDAQRLTPSQLTEQVKAADALRSALMKSSTEVAAANARLERLSAQANTLLATLSTARIAQAAAQSDATAQRGTLVRLGVELQSALDALGHLASDSYIQGGGPLADMAAVLEALTAASPDQSSNSMATVQYLVDGRARVFDRLRSLRAEQVLTSARAETASHRAAAAAAAAAQAKSQLDVVIAQQRAALAGFQVAQTDQVGQAAGLRGALLRSDSAAAKAADKRLAQALGGRDFTLLVDQSSSCGKDLAVYPNGRLPASALCPLFAAPGQSLTRPAALAFNAMSNDYQKQNGSPLCVTDSYRSYAEQVAVKITRGGFAATPGRSQHGLGLAVDLCGGVQSFASPAHLWMQRNAPLYGWFHPAWAEPSGALPEPWHWEFAG